MPLLRRKGLLALGACAALLLLPAPAQAVFHLMKVSEVAPSPAGAGSSFIELQMYEAGQNQVGGHMVRTYTSTGTLLGAVPIPSNVGNGDSQRTILIGSAATPGSPDFVTNLDTYLPSAAAGGAVCFESIDCVSWGGFTGAASLPSATGNPAPAIPTGSSLTRSITPGCNTLLENADDTNNSLADFSIAAPSPRNNSTAPTESVCATTNVKCQGKTATLAGTSGADNLKGTAKRDVIVALGGRDTVNGRGGNDLICGLAGKDNLKGGAGKDTLVGGAGADKLLGGAGKDKLQGQAGKDTCNGGPGSDTQSSCAQSSGSPSGPSGPTY
jgi:hypothetical protein